MQIFFSSVTALDQYTFSLNALPKEDACQHCLRVDQWVAHGYIYKQCSITKREVTGKRILCGKRYGKNGCGRTRQLYLKFIVPSRRASMYAVAIFISLLLSGAGVVQSYKYAINNNSVDTRHAWRWIEDLYARVGLFRSFFHKRLDYPTENHKTSKRINILLSTLKSIFFDSYSLIDFQKTYQSAFF